MTAGEQKRNVPIAARSFAFAAQPASFSRMQQTTSDTPSQWEESTSVSRLQVADASILRHDRHSLSEEQASSSAAQIFNGVVAEVAPEMPASPVEYATSDPPAQSREVAGAGGSENARGTSSGMK